jgi:hypothetical protein
MEDESPIYKYLNSSYNYNLQMKEILPKQSAYLILQMSMNQQHLYIGYLMIDKEQEFNYFLTKLTLSDFMIRKLETLTERIANLKSMMIKTVITIKEDQDKLEEEAEAELQDIIEELELFFEPVSEELDAVLHPPKSEREGDEEDDKKDDKKKDAGKKGGGGKDDMPAYESSLPLPESGIENLVLLLDT